MAGQAVDSNPTLADFDFDLPPERIAQHPLADRAASRLLHVETERLTDRAFADFEQLCAPGEVLVLNDTRVIRARLLGVKSSGGRVEALIERVLAPRRALALVRASHAPRPGQRLSFGPPAAPLTAIVEGRADDLFELAFDADLLPALERLGEVPLPPYIGHAPSAADAARYQTVFAHAPGAVAAPTAGLHFTEALLARLRARGVETVFVTLHVGAGTFQPIRVERLAQHRMHREWYSISAAAAASINAARAAGRRITAVGTTSLRALEAAALVAASQNPPGDATAARDVPAGAGDTDLFITPGFRFAVVDRLLTNFHLPRSTLLVLVAAFAGHARMHRAYAHAIANGYRFFSYGDAMLLERCP